MTEPTLEELSAYLDHELDAPSQARVAEHVASCRECEARLDGLRQAAYAVRALPMETPPRTFRVPQRRQSFRWAPVGWLGGAAAAVLVVAFGVTQLHGPAGSATSTSGGFGGTRAAAPAAPGNSTLDSHLGAGSQAYNASANTVTVTDPLDTTRSVTLSTDAKSYAASGTMTVRVRFTGLPSGQTGQVGLLLERNGYAVQLPTGSGPSDASGFQNSYQFANYDLSNPVGGNYTLILIEHLPGGNGDNLVARLPLTITP
jgi:predicted anti-sigma-YlaC factor YlaD